MKKRSEDAMPTIKSHPNLQAALVPFPFTVSKEDVKGSRVAHKTECAGARALCSIPGIEKAWVSRTRTVILFTSGIMLKWTNPVKLERAVDQYDGTAGLFPVGEYILRPLRKTDRPGVRHQRKDNRGTRRSVPKTRKKPAHVIR